MSNREIIQNSDFYNAVLNFSQDLDFTINIFSAANRNPEGKCALLLEKLYDM